MSYRLVKVTTFYPGYLAEYYRRQPGRERETYAEQLSSLMSDGFALADHYPRRLRELGVEAHELIANAKPLQQAWAREHGVKAKGEALVLAQIKWLRPDVLFLEAPGAFSLGWWRHLRAELPALRLVLAYHCVAVTDVLAEKLRYADLVLSCTPGFVDEFRSMGFSAQLVHHAFDPSVLAEMPQQSHEKETDLLFIGSLGGSEGFHGTRAALLEQLLAEGVKVDIRSGNKSQGWPLMAAKKAAYLAATGLRRTGLTGLGRHLPLVRDALGWRSAPRTSQMSAAMARAIGPPVYGKAYFRAMMCARTVFNSHIEAVGEFAGNMRLFEATGCGACLITDEKKNLASLFEPGKEVLSYRSPAECVEQVRWALGHPEACAEIGLAAQRRVYREHTYAHRARQLNGLILAHLNR